MKQKMSNDFKYYKLAKCSIIVAQKFSKLFKTYVTLIPIL